MDVGIDFQWNCFGGKNNISSGIDHVRDCINPLGDRHHCLAYLIGKNRGEIRNVQDTIKLFQESVGLAMQKMTMHIQHLEDTMYSQQREIKMLQNFVHQHSLQIQCLLLYNKLHHCDANSPDTKDVECNTSQLTLTDTFVIPIPV